MLVLTGPSRAGKTTVCRRIIEQGRARGLCVAGVLTVDGAAPDGTRLQSALDLTTGEQRLLATARFSGQTPSPALAEPDAAPRPRLAWTFDPRGVAFGRRAIERAGADECDLLVIDQVGPLELVQGRGWTVAFDVLERGRFDLALVVVNRPVVRRAESRLPGCRVVTVDDASRERLPAAIIAAHLPF